MSKLVDQKFNSEFIDLQTITNYSKLLYENYLDINKSKASLYLETKISKGFLLIFSTKISQLKITQARILYDQLQCLW